MSDYKQFANKVFINIVERMPQAAGDNTSQTEGIVTSVSQFVSLVGQIATQQAAQYGIPDANQLIPVEVYPIDLLWRVNNSQEQITAATKNDLTIVTYTADEMPGSKGAHSPFKNDGIKTIKSRLIDTYPDPDYTGYTIARVGKEIEAVITFNVWGFDDKNIRQRSLLLRKMIQDNIWYFKHKGLGEIVWLGAKESDIWDKLNIVRYKKEVYKILFTEVQELKEKNIEQFSVTLGIDAT